MKKKTFNYTNIFIKNTHKHKIAETYLYWQDAQCKCVSVRVCVMNHTQRCIVALPDNGHLITQKKEVKTFS